MMKLRALDWTEKGIIGPLRQLPRLVAYEHSNMYLSLLTLSVNVIDTTAIATFSKYSLVLLLLSINCVRQYYTIRTTTTAH